ncbi:MAG: CDP-diacylglycerol--glycerol-3-phosphate 3-phosphatidyltransferase, partial [Bacillota bacterium]|nr:CDP-diacylglycerol--glycerol-3-phosphate 3-phosphatidyltransferase [Bacillota bacterium]
VFASVTDFLDGYLARRLKLITNFGKFMDPVADKLLVLSSLMVFVELGELSSIVVILIFSRELIVSIFRAIAASQGIVISAGSLGKIKTTVQLITTMLLFARGWPFTLTPFPVLTWLIWATTVLTVASGIEYIYRNRAVLRG